MNTLMVMAGGTGGHIYPAMAVADHLQLQGWRIVWLATEGGMENRLIADRGYQIAVIRMRGVRGKGLLRKLAAPFEVLQACWQSWQAMRRHRPDVVLGMGGFAALPGGLVAWLTRRPLVVHEQNSIAGLTNRVLSRLADRVLVAFPTAFGEMASLVGNPVRPEIADIDTPELRMNERVGPLHVLVVGGSLGAQVLNEVVPQALAMMPASARPQVVHQAGEKHLQALREHYHRAGVGADIRAFLEDIATEYAWADVVICRAGALTIAELAAAGVASILVPFPYAVDDHQTHNARYLSAQGGAILLPQAELTPHGLAQLLSGLSREQLLDMARRARRLGRPRATAAVADICKVLAE